MYKLYSALIFVAYFTKGLLTPCTKEEVTSGAIAVTLSAALILVLLLLLVSEPMLFLLLLPLMLFAAFK
jgi:hypothetical protein